MKNELQLAAHQLYCGNTILYPTDTVWGLGCDATNLSAVQKIYALKERSESKALIVLVKDEEMLAHYVAHIPPKALELIRAATRPTTIIYEKAQHLAPNLIAEDGSIAIRIPNHDFCQALLKQFGKPIVSTSANISGQPTALRFADIALPIQQKVTHIVKPTLFPDKQIIQPSTIVKITNGNEIIVIRK